jgi:hypothetical protein
MTDDKGIVGGGWWLVGGRKAGLKLKRPLSGERRGGDFVGSRS